ncbi:hypothetical protein [Aequorivita echinoideorum]|uniref:Uncharacterized protein n=1 Tax=Aequorivita echinoideorum TaxID=1549647 RepID=A0ABS5S5B3_9FLAO|nr:hypothetical protein [Aequorivita echinoideorum]MBT0608408.1 hypothetical protein [Aequorivita echinoideorum]
MDELDILKKKWQQQEETLPQLSYKDIYKMILKKSSSIVKWIFYISIAEIVLWTVLSFFVPESSKQINEKMGLDGVFLAFNIINYLIFIGFIILFYRNYIKIKVTDSIKELMQNIIKTRKTVKYFVIYSVSTSALLLIGTNIYYYFNQHQLFTLIDKYLQQNPNMTEEEFLQIFFIIQVVLGLIVIGIMLLFYRIVYGILLRRLHNNYKELEKIEM